MLFNTMAIYSRKYKAIWSDTSQCRINQMASPTHCMCVCVYSGVRTKTAILAFSQLRNQVLNRYRLALLSIALADRLKAVTIRKIIRHVWQGLKRDSQEKRQYLLLCVIWQSQVLLYYVDVYKMGT